MNSKLRFLSLSVFLSAILACGDANPGDAADASGTGETMYVTASSGLRMRATPTTDGGRLAVIPQHAAVAVLERGEQTLTVDNIEAPWMRVRYGVLEGWVFGGYLSANPPAGAIAGEASTGFESGAGGVDAGPADRFAGVWQGTQLCDGELTRLEVNNEGAFTAYLFGGCDVTACQCEPASGDYLLTGDRICFVVRRASFPVTETAGENAGRACYRLAADGARLVVADGSRGFVENYGSEPLGELKRADSSSATE